MAKKLEPEDLMDRVLGKDWETRIQPRAYEQVVARALLALKPTFREIVEQVFLCGRSMNTLAPDLGLNTSAVHATCERAVRDLKESLPRWLYVDDATSIQWRAHLRPDQLQADQFVPHRLRSRLLELNIQWDKLTLDSLNSVASRLDPKDIELLKDFLAFIGQDVGQRLNKRFTITNTIENELSTHLNNPAYSHLSLRNITYVPVHPSHIIVVWEEG